LEVFAMSKGGRMNYGVIAVRAAEQRVASGRGVCARGGTPAKRRGGFWSQAANKATTTALQAPMFMPSGADVMRAIGSLYDDELQPYSRILRKRIIEQSETHGVCGADCDVGHIRMLCESMCDYLRVEPEDNGEWSALLMDRDPNFVDIYNKADDYPEEVWTTAEAYFKLLGESREYALPGGRYASAQALVARRLPFLQGYSVGQVCHFTQIAVSKRKLLGYADGTIVPYSRSTTMTKTRCAQKQQPVTSSAKAGGVQNLLLPVADWSAARAKLRNLLATATLRGSDKVPLSNVKRLFRSRYEMELSETALGHTKFTELLQDARFRDICEVRLHNHCHVVVPVQRKERKSSATDPQHRTALASKDLAQPHVRRAVTEPLMQKFAEQLQQLEEPPPVHRTFIHFQLPRPSSAVPRSHSQPCKGHDASECQTSWATSDVAPHDNSLPSCRRQLMCPEDEAFPHAKAWSVRPVPLSMLLPLYDNTAASLGLPDSSPKKNTPVSAERTQTSDSFCCTELRHDEPPRFPRFTMPGGRGPSEAAKTLKLACAV